MNDEGKKTPCVFNSSFIVPTSSFSLASIGGGAHQSLRPRLVVAYYRFSLKEF
jgi:hypothetical protein